MASGSFALARILPVLLDLSGRKSEKLKAGFLFTLEFDTAGKWRIVKTHQMLQKEVEKIERENEIPI